MQPSTSMLQALRTWAAVKSDRGTADALAGADAHSTIIASNAYSLGKIDGKAELARELLEDLARGE